MKMIIFLIPFFLFSCGRNAEKIMAPKMTFAKNVFTGFNTLSADKEFETEARDVTIIIYPRTEDMNGLIFSPTEERKESWEGVFNELTPAYRSRISAELGSDLTDAKKVSRLVLLIQTAGEVRDAKYRAKIPLTTEKTIIEKDIKKAQDELLPAIDQALEAFVCYYKARPRRGEKWDCKTEADADFKREKTPKNCEEMNEMNFTFSTSDIEKKYAENKSKCESNQAELDKRTSKLKERNQELNLEIEAINKVRDDAKSVVLDLLEAVEKNTGNIHVSTSSTLDKPLDCPGDSTGTKCLSRLVFTDNKKQDVRELTIYSDFGVYAGEKLALAEYSTKNGGISELKFYTDRDGVKILSFNLNTPSFTVSATLSTTIQEDMGLRFVGETVVRYPDGRSRKGVMKLEFNQVVNKNL
ncbi:MAG: hypothetical protein OHK0056_06520 [Bacteriovoracaceae bacterium]